MVNDGLRLFFGINVLRVLGAAARGKGDGGKELGERGGEARWDAEGRGMKREKTG